MKSRLLVFLSVLLFLKSAWSCSCGRYDILDVIADSENIVHVEVTDIEVVEESFSVQGYNSPGKLRAKYNVIDTFKGSAQNIPYLESVERVICCACHATLTLDRYILFSSGEQGIHLSTCGPIQVVSEYNEYLLELIPLIVNKVKPLEFSGVADGQWQQAFRPHYSDVRIELLNYIPKYRIADISFKGYSLSDGRIFVTDVLKEKDIWSGESEIEKPDVF